MKKCMFSLVVIVFLISFSLPAFAIKHQGWPTLNLTAGGYSLANSSGLDGQMTYGLKVGYEIDGNSLAERLGIEAVYQQIGSELQHTGEDVDVTLARLDFLYLFDPLDKKNKFQPFVTVGAGGVWVDGDDVSTSDPLVSYGGGARYFFTEYAGLRMDLRQNLVFDSGTRTDYEYTLGLFYRFGVDRKASLKQNVEDSDRDGVVDIRDKCPDTPRNLKVNKAGCPVDAPDSDADGVADYMDKCPETPVGFSVDTKGCYYDDDGDGVPNELDRCPSNPRGFQVDENGCTKLNK